MNETASREPLTITVKVFGGMRGLLADDKRRLTLPEGSVLSDVLRALERSHSTLAAKLREGMAAGYINTLLNGRNARFLKGDETPLRNGDTVAFLPPVGGG
jgi:molybdopterin converting factor small subunit